jgi:hypothetical protein
VLSEVFPSRCVSTSIYHIYTLRFSHAPKPRKINRANIGLFGLDDSSSESAQSFDTAISEISPHSPKAAKMEGVVDYASRFETLEEEFAELKAQNATMLSQQNDIIELLKLKLPDYLTPTRKNDSKLRPATPNDFDRDRSKGRNFIHSCDLYVKLVPHQFDNSDHKAIHWAISYMKSGHAALFARRHPLL